MNNTEKTRENRVRRVAVRRGLRLEKSRRRDKEATGYGGYRLIDTVTGDVIVGATPYDYSASLDVIKAALDHGLSADYGSED